MIAYKTATHKIARSAIRIEESPMNLQINSMYCIQALGKQYTALPRVPTSLPTSKIDKSAMYCIQQLSRSTRTMQKSAYRLATLKIARTALVQWENYYSQIG